MLVARFGIARTKPRRAWLRIRLTRSIIRQHTSLRKLRGASEGEAGSKNRAGLLYWTVKLVLAAADDALAWSLYVPVGSVFLSLYVNTAVPLLPVIPLRLTELPFDLVMIAFTVTPASGRLPES